MWSDDDLVMISAIEHYSYCPRQCGLIHVERIYDENVFTLRGRQAHERTHEPVSRTEDGARIERGLPLWSERLGLTGVGDVVEFQADGRVFPVEYKHGTNRSVHSHLQLCAQAFCLEEMLGVEVAWGAVYLTPVSPEARDRTGRGPAAGDGTSNRGDPGDAGEWSPAAPGERRALPALLAGGCLRPRRRVQRGPPACSGGMDDSGSRVRVGVGKALGVRGGAERWEWKRLRLG